MTRAIGSPEPGFFKVRNGKAGPWVPARIFRWCHCTINGGDDNWAHAWEDTCDRFPHELGAEIDGKQVDLLRVWHSGREIPEAEYRYLKGDREWCHQHAPERLDATTPRDYFRVDLMPPIF